MQTATRFFIGAALAALLPLAPARAQQLDPAFHVPVFVPAGTQTTSYIRKVARQADGRYVVAGNFQSVDGHHTAGLARLLGDGWVDTTFTFRSSGLPVGYRNWSALAVQADGRVLVSRADTARQGSLVRLLPTGRPDVSFRPALAAQVGGQGIGRIFAQADGTIVLGGNVVDSLGRHGVVRLLSSGRVDVSFRPPIFPAGFGTSVLAELSGRILVARSTFLRGDTTTTLVRLLRSGRLDSSFVFRQNPAFFSHINLLALCPSGSYALGGSFGRDAVARVLPNGAWDTFSPSFQNARIYNLNTYPPCVLALAAQADGRILAVGYMGSPLVRSLPMGGYDNTFSGSFLYTPNAGGHPTINDAEAEDLLLQPDGKLLVAGQFAQAGGVPHYGLARLLAAAPLATATSVVAPDFEMWPVPARGELHVALPAARAAQKVELLDVLGRVVLTRMPTGAPTLTLPTAGLPTSLYLLRVQYAMGQAATRRVVLE